MGTIQAAILRAKLRHLPERTARRQALAQTYLHLLDGLPVVLLHIPPDRQSVWHRFMLRVPARAAIQAHLLELGVETSIHYTIPPHL
ncbi:MAG: DegT/DnrJ/EryC1/StrS family aminotransferase [Thermoflexales bacterium]